MKKVILKTYIQRESTKKLHAKVMELYWKVKQDYEFTDIRIWRDFLYPEYGIEMGTFKYIKKREGEQIIKKRKL